MQKIDEAHHASREEAWLARPGLKLAAPTQHNDAISFWEILRGRACPDRLFLEIQILAWEFSIGQTCLEAFHRALISRLRACLSKFLLVRIAPRVAPNKYRLELRGLASG